MVTAVRTAATVEPAATLAMGVATAVVVVTVVVMEMATAEVMEGMTVDMAGVTGAELTAVIGHTTDIALEVVVVAVVAVTAVAKQRHHQLSRPNRWVINRQVYVTHFFAKCLIELKANAIIAVIS